MSVNKNYLKTLFEILFIQKKIALTYDFGSKFTVNGLF